MFVVIFGVCKFVVWTPLYFLVCVCLMSTLKGVETIPSGHVGIVDVISGVVPDKGSLNGCVCVCVCR